MLGLSWAEIGLIIGVAILVVKPEDLPGIIKTASGYIKKIKNFADEIKKTVVEAAGDINLKEEEKQLRQQIVDLEGNLQDTYSLDDVMPFIKDNKQKKPENE